MTSLFINQLINALDTNTLSIQGVISSDKESNSLWSEDIVHLSFLDSKLIFKNLYLEPFKNFSKYSIVTILIEDALGNIKLNKTLSIYELSTLNTTLSNLTINDNDLLKFTLNSYILIKDNNTISETSEEIYNFFTFHNVNIESLTSLRETELIERSIFDKLIIK